MQYDKAGQGLKKLTVHKYFTVFLLWQVELAQQSAQM